jgi:hemerythrin-like metal-binding protein
MYVLGILEMDAQHEAIAKVVETLQEVASNASQRMQIHPTLIRLNELLSAHFSAEEAFMAMISYSDIDQHKKNHRALLKLFAHYFDHPPAPAEHEYLCKHIGDSILGHVKNEDAKLTEFFQEISRHLAYQ